ncbi:class I SAM-dependent methyltransferase [Isosphaeraceae bacterium EP7]
MRRDLGDFQTPPNLAARVLDLLGPIGSRWTRVLEPTCGKGHFLAALLDRPDPPRELIGIERQAVHLAEAHRACDRPDAPRVVLTEADLFTVDLARDLPWTDEGPLLVVGNPPWVTAAELGVLESQNQAPRLRGDRRRGLDALTGSSNFDLAEAVWIKLLTELAPQNPTIALLCKRSVARKILAQGALPHGVQIKEASIHRIDARRWFGVQVDACLLRIDVGVPDGPVRVAIHGGLDAEASVRHFERDGDQLIADAEAWGRSKFAAGGSPLTWRQGIKHDAAKVMELVGSGEGWINGLGEPVDIEPDHMLPLWKSTDLFHGVDGRPRRALVLSQSRLGEETEAHKQSSPRLWAYLDDHAWAFDRRKSSIYRGRPRFSLFGVGPYCFDPFKVAISGLHKSPRFRAIGPVDGRPAVFDDTCYLLPCRSAVQAALLASLLNGPIARDLLDALVFWDAKRPITKAVLRQIDPIALLRATDPLLLGIAMDGELRRLGVDPDIGHPDSWGDLLLDGTPMPASPLI